MLKCRQYRPGVIERRLLAQLSMLANPKTGRTTAMIDVVNAAGLWTDALVEFSLVTPISHPENEGSELT